MSKRLLCCLGLLVALVISTGLAEAATTGKISGRVTEVTGDPLARCQCGDRYRWRETRRDHR